MIKNDIYIVGGDHHNMLGIIRMLGENKIFSNVIIKGEKSRSFCKKSKYIRKCIFVDDLESMRESINKIPQGSIIIPTGDESALLIDNDKKILQSKYIIQSINHGKKNMSEYMDKYFQSELLKKYNINTAQSWHEKLDDIDIDKYQKYPLILKPQMSVDGNKDDIIIVNNCFELKTAIQILKSKKYNRILIQEYINMLYECGLNGCCCNGNIFIPAVLRKIRIYPQKRGNVSYGKIVPLKDSGLNLDPIRKLLKDINYNGFFDIELFVTEDGYYLNEINFRNSGNSYVYTKGKVNLALLWIKMNLGLSINGVEPIKKSYYFRDEFLELKQLASRNINIFEYISAAFNSKCNFVKNLKDPGPYFEKFLIHFKRRKNV